MTRMEARRAARAAKESFAVIASRAVGEIFITFGVLMLLFVVYQLVWTNVQAGMEVDEAKNRITEDWAKGGAGAPKAFEAGEGFAILHIPKLDVAVPVAEGIDKEKVLDKGLVGHYAEGALKTAMLPLRQGGQLRGRRAPQHPRRAVPLHQPAQARRPHRRGDPTRTTSTRWRVSCRRPRRRTSRC